MRALAVTAQLCGPELERYGRCVAASPGSWHRDCHQLSLSVTECASNHPLVRRIRRDCSDSFGAFERCLRERPRSAAECGPHVSQFLLCAQNGRSSGGVVPRNVPASLPNPLGSRDGGGIWEYGTRIRCRPGNGGNTGDIGIWDIGTSGWGMGTW
uniref:Coiled-coil-helix-coiled-coil-helix domain containing 5 n=1 Tax=Serinus canaria TaxID=9135 RepID=A0A8C9U8V7_SERCA